MKVLLVDDHATVRDSLRQLIELGDEFEVAGEGSNGAEAIDRVDELRPDIVLMDMNMPVMNGADATRTIKERHPEIQVLALTAFADMSLVAAMVKAGAAGYLLKGGTSAELLGSMRAIAQGQGSLDKEVTRGVMEDMAVLYEREQERANALEELDRMKSEFVSVVSHELRTPVTSIKGGVDTLRGKWSSVPDDVKLEFLDSMAQECDRLTRMIGQILTVSSIQRGGLGLSSTSFSLATVVDDALDAVAHKRGDNRVIRVDLSDVVASGDRKQLVEVASSLIANCLDHTSSDVEVRVVGQGGFARLEVLDDGPGLDPPTLQRLLNEPFSQGDSSSTRAVGGLGLSLYIARQVLEASGGRLEVVSEADRGSTFSMVLPAAPAPGG